MSLWMSDYLDRLHGLYQASLARTAEGDWQIRGMDALRTVRLDPQMGWPDLMRSQGVAGVRDLPQGRYVALSSDRALLVLRPDRDSARPWKKPICRCWTGVTWMTPGELFVCRSSRPDLLGAFVGRLPGRSGWTTFCRQGIRRPVDFSITDEAGESWSALLHLTPQSLKAAACSIHGHWRWWRSPWAASLG